MNYSPLARSGFVHATRCIATVVLTGVALQCRWAVAQEPKSTDEIVAKVKAGTSRRDARRIIEQARPGDGYTWSDSSLQWSGHNRERYQLADSVYVLLSYTTSGLRISPDDHVESVCTATFQDLRGIVPPELFQYVELIHKSPSLHGRRFNPVNLIRAVNGLRGAGRERASQSLRKYVELSAPSAENEDRNFAYDLDGERVLLVARLLFTSRANGRPVPDMSYMKVGTAQMSRATASPKLWPLWPLIVENDIPFMPSPGYDGNGPAVGDDLNYYLHECDFRASELTPTALPLSAADKITESARWVAIFELQSGEDQDVTRGLLRKQALRSMACLLDARVLEAALTDQSNEAWERCFTQKDLAGAHWDAAPQRFTRGPK